MEGENRTQGWVYVVTNPSLPGLVKVGYTTRQDVNKRLREFDQAGLPYPYEVAYKVWVAEPQKLEKRVHQFLTIQRESKEWFRCSVERAKEAVEHLAPVHRELIQKQETSPALNNFSDSAWPGYSEEPNSQRKLDSYRESERKRESKEFFGIGIISLFLGLLWFALPDPPTEKPVILTKTKLSSERAKHFCPQGDGLVFHVPSASHTYGIHVCQDGKFLGRLTELGQFERETMQARRWIMDAPLRRSLEIPDFHSGFDTALQGKSFVRKKLKSQMLQ